MTSEEHYRQAGDLTDRTDVIGAAIRATRRGPSSRHPGGGRQPAGHRCCAEYAPRDRCRPENLTRPYATAAPTPSRLPGALDAA